MFEVVKLEFSKWLETIDKTNLSCYEKALIGIIIDHFDDIASCGTAAGARAKLIGQYIEALNKKADREDLSMLNAEVASQMVKGLRSLSVGHFRGFGTEENFDFSTQYTFYHGPNGSGKTSFCEAIEYCVLGTVAEASSRGITLDKYLAHGGRKSFDRPKLDCILPTGEIGPFPTSFSTYRFAFIEKNRIMDFSHISAATSKNQVERIASLFGLTDFQTFVHEFTDSFDKRYLTLEFDETQVNTLTQQKKSKLDQSEKLSLSIEDKKNELQVLINTIGKPDLFTADEAIEYLTNVETGLIPLAQKTATEHHMDLINEETVQNLSIIIDEFLRVIDEIERNNTMILSDIGAVNMSELFNAVTEIEEAYSENVCPVCKTPLTLVTHNPFDYAREELKKLKAIDDAKKKVETCSKKAASYIQQIISYLSQKSIASLFDQMDIETICSASLQENDYKMVSTGSICKVVGCIENVNLKLSTGSIKSCIDKNNAIAIETNKRYDDRVAELQKQYGDISRVASAIDELQKQIDSLSKDISDISEKAESAKTTLSELKELTSFNNKMVEAYESIRRKLAIYVSNLPAKLSANLSEKVRGYYNFINQGDADFELIEELKLPLSASEKISVKMKDGLIQDALQILSEGHVRILGLAILLSKAVTEGMPFVVFDDIVNSIDDDHRNGVASLLMTHSDFTKMQMILTCHGELFVNCLESYVDNERKLTRYMFLPADTLEERGVVIKYRDSTIPLKQAHEKYENGKLKDAAAKCRQAVECIASALWKKISPIVGGISIKLRNLQSTPDLRTVVDGLRLATTPSKIRNADLIHDLLEKLTSNRAWNLLNKGTHVDESLPEFSRVEIKELIGLLDLLNNEVKALKVTATAESPTTMTR